MRVAPFVGAWIETSQVLNSLRIQLSLPSWERGLKHIIIGIKWICSDVAPFVGAWIETRK